MVWVKSYVRVGFGKQATSKTTNRDHSRHSGNKEARRAALALFTPIGAA